MNTITEYKTVSAYTIDALDDQVNDLIRKGWEPVGSVTVVSHASTNPYKGEKTFHREYVQNMVRYETL